MKKIINYLVIIICSLILAYGLFVGVDCVRLYNTDVSESPIISTKPTQNQNDEVKYTGLGYTITYEIKDGLTSEGNGTINTVYDICGAEFRLFDKILLWAWIEDSDVELEKFSYEKESSEIGENAGGIKRKDFYNTENISINSKEQAVELAKNELTVEYDSVFVAFDEESEVWKVVFFKKSQLGGGQTVYLNKDGVTQLCIWGE